MNRRNFLKLAFASAAFVSPMYAPSHGKGNTFRVTFDTVKSEGMEIIHAAHVAHKPTSLKVTETVDGEVTTHYATVHVNTLEFSGKVTTAEFEFMSDIVSKVVA